MGTGDGEAMLKEGVSGVVAGFTAKELLTAFAVILAKFPQGKPFFKNCYPRVVKAEGSPAAQALMKEVMEPCDSEWRGLGVIPQSGQLRRPVTPARNTAYPIWTVAPTRPAAAATS